MSYTNKTHVILIFGEVSTSQVSLYLDDLSKPDSMLIYYKDEKRDCRIIPKSHVRVLTRPQVFDPQKYSFTYKGEALEDVYIGCKFREQNLEYWTISFLTAREDIVCKGEELQVRRKSFLSNNSEPLDYLKTMAYFRGYELRNENNPAPLGSQYRLLGSNHPLLRAYLRPEGFKISKKPVSETLISPFGLNSSQLKAMRNALCNRVSIIQGPPGTGKTQTILNILANLIVAGKTALVVAGSNDATRNVYDKLKSYGLDFLVAKLGNSDNISDFIAKQKAKDFCKPEWDKDVDLAKIEELTAELEPLFKLDKDIHRRIQIKNTRGIKALQKKLLDADFEGKSAMLKRLSMDYLKRSLWDRFGNRTRRSYKKNDLEDVRTCRHLLQDYPIVLSTAFSSTRTIPRDILYDYVIMDESSQIDVATGALALSCARNAVIVGDLKQLPNVIPGDVKTISDEIFKFFDIPERFNFSDNSFLQSICKTFPKAPEVTLLEHYRCHPKIAGFFNNEFYDGKLVVMTEDKGEEDVLILRHTVPGNHAVERRNSREEEELEDIMKVYNISEETVDYGIITPYKNQVARIKGDDDILQKDNISTVHMFQGQEKDTIIISTVDNHYTDFANDPHLLNVAVSRAKKRLFLITNGNEGNTGHIMNLVNYMKQNGKEEEGKVKSLFDLINTQYEDQRAEYVASHSPMPEEWLTNNEAPSPAETIAYCFITDVLKEFPGYIVHYEDVLDDYIPDNAYDSMSDEERTYIVQPDTHIDFLILREQPDEDPVPVLAIEIDGETYHRGSDRNRKDRMKDRIVEKVCGIPMLRLGTKDSIDEEERLKRSILCDLIN